MKSSPVLAAKSYLYVCKFTNLGVFTGRHVYVRDPNIMHMGHENVHSNL